MAECHVEIIYKRNALLIISMPFCDPAQKSSFSTGFIRFFDTAECHVVYSEKPNAFLIILESTSQKMHLELSKSIRFMDKTHMAFCHVVNLIKPVENEDVGAPFSKMDPEISKSITFIRGNEDVLRFCKTSNNL